MNLKKVFYVLIFCVLMFTPTFCFADDYIENENLDVEIQVSSDLSKIPTINARHAVVLDRKSKTVLFGKNENEKCKMASTTKIMTSIVVIENCKNLNDVVTVSKKAARNWWFKTWVIHK